MFSVSIAVYGGGGCKDQTTGRQQPETAGGAAREFLEQHVRIEKVKTLTKTKVSKLGALEKFVFVETESINYTGQSQLPLS